MTKARKRAIEKERMKGAVRTQPRKDKMVKCLAETGMITRAAKAAGIPLSRHYQWMKSDPEYALAIREAMEQAADLLEEEAIRRARDGVKEPVYYKGEIVGYVYRYSDGLLKFLLQHLKKKVYGNRLELAGEGGPIRFTLVLDDPRDEGDDGEDGDEEA